MLKSELENVHSLDVYGITFRRLLENASYVQQTLVSFQSIEYACQIDIRKIRSWPIALKGDDLADSLLKSVLSVGARVKAIKCNKNVSICVQSVFGDHMGVSSEPPLKTQIA